MDNKGKLLKCWEMAALLSLSLLLCAAAWAQGRQNHLREGVLRLHVVAVSDSAQEQAQKLQVRDNVLACVTPLLETAADSRQARAILEAHLADITRAAEEAAAGRCVTVSLGEESFPTRSYEGIRLPAGRYQSLRIVLGEGQGKNWWCVVFPASCLPAAQAEETAGNLSQQELLLVTDSENRALRFGLVELWGKLITMRDS